MLAEGVNVSVRSSKWDLTGSSGPQTALGYGDLGTAGPAGGHTEAWPVVGVV